MNIRKKKKILHFDQNYNFHSQLIFQEKEEILFFIL